MMDFPGLMAALFALHGKRLSDGRLEAYAVALGDVPLELLAAAVREAMRSCKFLPTPAELRELIAGGNADEQAMAAWLTLNRAIRKVGPYEALLVADHAWSGAVEDVFGGWPEANDARRKLEEPAWQAKRKEFVVAYQRRRRQTSPTQDRAYLSGLADRANRWTQHTWERAVPVRRWIAVLEADDRILNVHAPYNDSGRPQLPATVTPTPLRLPPPSTPDVEPCSREEYLLRRKATLERLDARTASMRADVQTDDPRAQWADLRRQLRNLREQRVEPISTAPGDDAHYEKVQRQIAEWRASTSAQQSTRELADPTRSLPSAAKRIRLARSQR